MHILIQIEAFCPFHRLPAHLHMYTHVLCVTLFINTLEIEGISVSDGELCICIWLPCWICIVKSYCQVELGLNISFLQLWRLWCCYPSNTYQNERIYRIGCFGKIKPLLEFKKVFFESRDSFLSLNHLISSVFNTLSHSPALQAFSWLVTSKSTSNASRPRAQTLLFLGM